MQNNSRKVLKARRFWSMSLMVCALLISTVLSAGCGVQGPASQQDFSPLAAALAQATASPAASQTVLPAATQPTTGTATLATPATSLVTPTITITSSLPTAAATSAVTTTGTSTATATVSGTDEPSPTPGTPTPRPIPSGTPPDPYSVINIYQQFGFGSNLVRQDRINLDGKDVDNILFTLSSQEAITQENSSNVNVLNYDPVYREWNIEWASPAISGTASPLLSIAQSNLGGLNGGDLLRTGKHILMLHTITRDGHAHMSLFRWNGPNTAPDTLQFVPAGGGAARSQLDADLDINLADIDNDGVYEVVADNAAGVQIWKWDGNQQKFVVQEQR